MLHTSLARSKGKHADHQVQGPLLPGPKVCVLTQIVRQSLESSMTFRLVIPLLPDRHSTNSSSHNSPF